MKDLSQKLGTRVRAFRVGMGMTQAALAQAAGLTNGYLSDVERSKANISITNLDKLAEALGVPLATLLDCEDADRDALMAAIEEHCVALPTYALRVVRHLTCLMTHSQEQRA